MTDTFQRDKEGYERAPDFVLHPRTTVSPKAVPERCLKIGSWRETSQLRAVFENVDLCC